MQVDIGKFFLVEDVEHLGRVGGIVKIRCFQERHSGK